MSFLILLLVFSSQAMAQVDNDDSVYRMREYDTNYFITGEPDTKVQFSFQFRLLKHYDFNLGFTEILFWDLGKKESNPFSEINFNPELFYRYEIKNDSHLKTIKFGWSHLSNGEKGEASRSIEALYLQLIQQSHLGFGVQSAHIRFRYFFSPDKTNKDIRDYRGPIIIKLFFTSLGEKIFKSEEAYVEYYNGGKFAGDFSKSSVRVSLRFKVWTTEYAPKIFIQYFNGYGENLKKYNIREETYRIGFSVGGY